MGHLLIVGGLQLFDQIILLLSQLVRLSRVQLLEVYDVPLVVVFDELEVLMYLKHCLAVLSSFL